MQSKRDGLVPIGEIMGEWPAPLKPAKPQAVRPFTQADQVNALVGASEADPDSISRFKASRFRRTASLEAETPAR